MKGLSFWLLATVMTGTVLVVGCYKTHTVQEQAAVRQTEQKLPRGKATKRGLFREQGAGWLQGDPKASTGKVIRGVTLEFTEDTDRIPLRKGVRFGYRYWLKFAPDQKQVRLKRVLIHPEMTLPNGSKVTRSERTIGRRTTHGIVTSIDAYALSEDYELVEGEWIFQLWYQDKMLAEQRFTTYWPVGEQATGEAVQ